MAEPKLHKDPLTGEMVNKRCLIFSLYYSAIEKISAICCSELKRREKQRAKDAAKAAQPAPVSQKAQGPKEDELTPNVRTQSRNVWVKV